MHSGRLRFATGVESSAQTRRNGSVSSQENVEQRTFDNLAKASRTDREKPRQFQFLKKTGNSSISQANLSHQQGPLQGSRDLITDVGDQAQKLTFLNPQKIKSFIARIQKGAEVTEKRGISQKETQPGYNGLVRNIVDSQNLLFRTTRNVTETLDEKQKADQNQFSLEERISNLRANAADSSKQLDGMQTRLSFTDSTPLVASKLVNHHSPKEGNAIKYFALNGMKRENFTVTSSNHGKKTSESDLSAKASCLRLGQSTSKDFLQNINQCISRLEGKIEDQPAAHRRDHSLFDSGLKKYNTTEHKSQKTLETAELNQFDKAEKTAKIFANQHKRGEKSYHSQRQASLENRNRNPDTLEAQNLVMHNEMLQQKVLKLKSKLKEESICKEYWKEKYKDLEKRYNDLIMQSVRSKGDQQTKKKSTRTDVLYNSQEKISSNFLTFTTQESSQKLSGNKNK